MTYYTASFASCLNEEFDTCSLCARVTGTRQAPSWLNSSGPCENGETKGFEILARIIEDRKDGLEVALALLVV